MDRAGGCDVGVDDHPGMTDGLWRRTESQLVDGLETAAQTMFAQEIDILRLTAELTGRRTDVGNPAHVAAFLARCTTMSLHVARGLVEFAQRLQAHRPVFEAYSEASISKPAAQMIIRFLDDPPEAMPSDALAQAESTLIAYAGSSSRRDLAAMIDGIREHYTDVPVDGGTGSDAGHGAGADDRAERGSGAEPASGASGSGHDSGGGNTGPGCRGGLGPLRRRSDTFGGDDTTRNALHISRTLGGRYALRGDLDCETGERLAAALSPLAAPRPEPDGTRDRRCAAKRRADGLAEFLRRHTRCSQGGDGGAGAASAGTTSSGHDTAGTSAAGSSAAGSNAAEHGAVRDIEAGSDGRRHGSAVIRGSDHDFGGGAGTGTTLAVYIGLRDLADTDCDRAHRARLIEQGRYAEVFDDLPHGITDWFGAIPVSAVRRLACDAAIAPVGVDGGGVPLNLGRTRRLASTSQRRALAVRDHGCAFPRCDRPPAWCIAHHIHHWVDGGPTDMGNLVSLCTEHHRSVHHHGWTVVIDSTRRRPRFLPPPRSPLALQWLDSDGNRVPPPE